MELLVLIVVIGIGYFAGTFVEKKHYRSIKAREHKYLNLLVLTNSKNTLDEKEIESVRLVYGSAVISIDYFKRMLASLRNLFGGEVSSYESLLDRARREAILRMKEMAAGADLIFNLRIETSAIGFSANKGNLGSMEALAYGTAVTIRR